MARHMFTVCLLLACGCNSSGPPTEMTVPAGHTGPVWIILDETAPAIPLVEGKYRVVIPAGGVLRVKSFDPFYRWHQMSARYDNGMALPTVETNSDPDRIELRGGGNAVTTRGGRDFRYMSYFVGTETAYSELWNGPNWPQPPE